MTWYAGIDLGTTNSAIATFDGVALRLHKSPEQNDVTPSVLYFGPRGSRFVGQRAYTAAARNPKNAAMLFKRLMGSRTPIEVPGTGLTLTPEECSAELLRTLVGYLPEETRGPGLAGTVITVPAAFDQLQKEATMAAATQANIGAVALMQEPVAAVMSVMRARPDDGRFLVFDLGGGTLDVAIAESTAGRVTLLANGGIAVCGGRDFDRAIIEQVVLPWLAKQFSISGGRESGLELAGVLAAAVETAKKDLSTHETTRILLQEEDSALRDAKGESLYLDIPFDRRQFNELIGDQLAAAVQAARDTMRQAGLSPGDIDRMVFVGGPTKYKPLRDLVSGELGIPVVSEIDPMTAVAEGAAIFAEAVDWNESNRGRKPSRGQLAVEPGGIRLEFRYTARTPALKGRIAAAATGPIPPGTEFQVDSLETGWSSGRLGLREGLALEVPLAVPGENRFKVFLFSAGLPITLENSHITIARTAASVDAIPASHSIAVEVLEKIGGVSTLEFLVRAGDALPKKGRVRLKAAETLKAGSSASINIKLWEGEIRHPVTDNRPIGTVKILGTDIDEGLIASGADLDCDFEVLDSGTVSIQVSVPSIGQTFHSGRNFYSPQDGQINFATAAQVVSEKAKVVLDRIDKMSESVESERLDAAREAVALASQLEASQATPEACKEADNAVLSALRILSETRSANLKDLRETELTDLEEFVEEAIKPHARETEAGTLTSLFTSARRVIAREGGDFENYLAEIRSVGFGILWRQDWFVVDRFNGYVSKGYLFPDSAAFAHLVSQGREAIESADISRLRSVVGALMQGSISDGSDDDLTNSVNILRG